LSKLGVGISKADLKAKSFKDITDELAVTFAGSATASANTFQGSMDKLGVASANVKEIIGTGLIDALKGLGENTSITDLASNMEKTAIYLADVIRGVGVLSNKLKDIPVIGNFNVGMIPIVGAYLELLRKAGTKTGELTSADNAHLKSLEDAFKIIKKTGVVTTKLTADELKKLKAKQLQIAIDKANLALGKGGDVFDMDKIQLQAAEISQAQQLGKVTNQAQLLQITNDLARVKLKQDIIALEDAIASKDEAAIKAATAKLNADLGIVGALTGQNLKLTEIKTILDTIAPKDLINQDNLDLAIAKLRVIAGGATGSTASTTAALSQGSFVPIVAGTGGVMGGSSSAGAYASSGFPGSDKSTAVNITVNTGIGDPNAIAEAIQEVIRGAVDRGTLRAV
jgi:hypothetical protein